MRIAITGSTGMIGSTLANTALNNGCDVIAIVRPHSKRLKNLPKSDRLKIIECDIADYCTLNECHEQCDILYHLAWENTYGSERDDVDSQIENISYTMDATRLAKAWGAKKFIGAGSQAEYGTTDQDLNGNTPTNPTSGYGIAKYAAGKMSRILCDKLGLEHCWARIVSTYGIMDMEKTLISYLIDTLLKYETPNLTRCEQTWDYLFSEDAANAFLAIGLHGINGKTYCLGSGVCRPMKYYVECIKDAIDPSLKINYGAIDYFPHQPMHLCADIKELTSDTGFVPEYSFEEGIRKTIAWKKQEKSQ